RLIEGRGNGFGGFHRRIHQAVHFLGDGFVFGRDQVAQAGAFERAAVETTVFAAPHVTDADRVGDDVAMRVVGEAGVLVFLALRIERHFHALAGEFAARQDADAGDDFGEVG